MFFTGAALAVLAAAQSSDAASAPIFKAVFICSSLRGGGKLRPPRSPLQAARQRPARPDRPAERAGEDALSSGSTAVVANQSADDTRLAGAAGEERRSFAKDARQLVDQGAHARCALHVGVDDEPDVQPVGLLAWKRALQPGSGIAHEARQIARAPAEAHGLEDSCDAVGPKSNPAARDAILDIAQGQLDAVGIAHRGELCRFRPPSTD